MATGLPQYKYGKVTGLSPDLTVVSERSESPMVCCGYCSAHMASITAKMGLSTKMTNEAHQIRAKGGRPHNAGSSASELRSGAQAALGVTLKSIAVADIPARLRAGFAVLIAVQYQKLPDWLTIQQNDFGHSALLFGWDEPNDRAGYFDPLWVQGARGAWTPWNQITPALWANGNHSTTTVRLVLPMAGDYVIYDDQVTSLKTGKIAASTPFYNDWQLSAKRGAVGGSAITAQIMGHRDNSYAIQVQTAQGWSDGISRPTLVFVSNTKVSGITDNPAPIPPPDGGDGYTEEDLLAAKQEGYDLALSVFPPRPE